MASSRRRRAERARPREAVPAAVTATPPAAADRWTTRGPLLAAAVALAVYLPSLAGGFLYDDVAIVVENRRIQDLGALGTVLRYEPSRPLLSLTWAVNYALAGRTPWPYHLVNVFVHAGNALLVASLFLWMARRRPGPHRRGGAVLGACLFAATPMAAETVAYVASRSTALASLFVLASLRLAVSALETESRFRHAAALGLFLLALSTKEEAAAAPLLLLLLDFFFLAGQDAGPLRRRWRWHAAFWLLPFLGLLARRMATGDWLPPAVLPRGQYLLTQWAAFPLYLLRALVPLDPAFFRDATPASWPPSTAIVAWGLLAAAVALAAILGRRRWPDFSFAVAWMAAALVPSSSIVPLNEMVVDHRAYLGGAGVLFAVGSAVWRPERRYFAAALLALLAARAWHYQRVLGDPVRAWEDAVQRAPRSADAYRGLAEAYASRGDPRAEPTLKHAASLAPADSRAWANLGVQYAASGRLEDAVTAFRAALRVDPGDARTHDNLGLVLQALGRLEEAKAEYEAAAAVDPRLAQPRIRLAAILLEQGDRDRARALVEEAARLEIDPADAEAIQALRQRLR